MTTHPEIKFGTDGWRGEMARDFTFPNVRKVAQAIADYVKSSPKIDVPGGKPLALGPKVPLVVGYDNRFQSEHFAEQVARVLNASGLKATLSAEALPTPAVTWLTAKTGAKLGVVVTASHNAPSWNGIKIKLEGRAAPESVTLGVEGFLGKNEPQLGGADTPKKSYRAGYLSFLKSKFDTAVIARKLSKPAVIDYMHGAACGLMADVLPSRKLISIRDRRDPLFGGIHPEPIEKYLGALSKAVLKNKAVIGIGLDGDADRIGLVDEKGRYLTPCQVFPMLMEYVLETRKLKGKVVQSLSMGFLSKRAAKAHGLAFEEVPVGFKFIAEKMLSEDVSFGGEESGGYSWKGMLPERDGMATALLFLEMVGRTRKTPGQLYAAVEKKYGKSYYVRRDIKIAKPMEKKGFLEKLVKAVGAKPAGLKTLEKKIGDGAKLAFENDEWLLMRPSGTEPLIRTYAETGNPKKTEALLDAAEKAVRQLIA